MSKTSEISKVAVLGSGVMGASIAAHIANAGISVMLYDIVPDGTRDRRELAKNAITNLQKIKPSPLSHKKKAKLIEPANLEDDLHKLADCDWIIEAVIEKVEIKHDVYAKVNKHKKPDAVLSSNTSTLPLRSLVEGMDEKDAKNFMITHFFNPPRYMRLFELVITEKTDKKAVEKIRRFADVNLGKAVVDCVDTPGFIANRIGVYWLISGLMHAIEQKISVEEADLVMSRPIGVPKTGVFGLFDLIGIDLMPLIAKAMLELLPKDDPFVKIYDMPELIEKMIADGYTGRKGRGGFYRLNKDGGKKIKEAINLQTGEYALAQKPKSASAHAAKKGLMNMMMTDDAGGRYAKLVVCDMLYYSAMLLGEISDDILKIDEAMRTGYAWKYGPFELIDKMADSDSSGADNLAKILEERGIEIPQILRKAAGKSFYRTHAGKRQYLDINGEYQDIPVKEGVIKLVDIKAGGKPLAKTGSAKLWDIGDGVACLEFTSKMNSLDPEIMKMINKAVELIPEKKMKGLIIGGDSDNFSVGANLGFFLYTLNIAAWDMMSQAIKDGQNAYMALKYAPFPVIGAMHGMTLGGGCEMNLHCDAVQAHLESYAGLVEVGVGIIPGWGGCKELLYRNIKRSKFGGPIPGIKNTFESIAMAKVATSADEAKDMGFLNDKSRITMNRDRLLGDAKELCLELAKDYIPPQPAEFRLPGRGGAAILKLAVDGFAKQGIATAHDVTVGKKLAEVLTGGKTNFIKTVSEQDMLDLEHDIFMELVKTKPSIARIEHMMLTNKPLRN